MVKFFFFLFGMLPFAALAAPRLEMRFIAPPDTLYAGQEAFFEIKLLDGIGLTNIGIIPAEWPEVELFLNFNRTKADGKVGEVKTFSFSFVPKKAGRAVFAPLCLSADAPSMISVRDLPEFVTVTPDGRVRVCAPSFSFDAKPLPAGAAFAAAGAEMFDGITPNVPEIKAGSPVKRSLVLTAKGTLPAYLPDFAIKDMPDVRIYKGKTERTVINAPETLVAAVRQTVVFVPQRAGMLVLPETSVAWTDTRTGRITETKIPARTLKVLPAETVPEHIPEQPEKQEKVEQRNRTDRPDTLWIIPAVIAAFAAARLSGRKRRRAKAEVMRAGGTGDPAVLATALIRWGKQRFTTSDIRNLSGLCAVYAGADDGFAHALDDLQEHLYATGRFAKHFPDAEEKLTREVTAAFERAERIKIKQKRKTVKRLPDLYP